jgi:hypothetical protein
MLKLDLRPFRAELGVGYDAAFLYLGVRGAVAEKWGHVPGFGRHLVGVDALRLTNKSDSRIAEANLKNSRYVASGVGLSWDDFMKDSQEFITDCLKAFRPDGVSSIYADVRFYSEASSFGAATDAIATPLLTGEYRHPPTSVATLEDVSVALAFKESDITIGTTIAPMHQRELDPHLDGEPDLSAYPDELVFVQRRYEIRLFAESRYKREKIGWEAACSRVEALAAGELSRTPSSVPEYVAHVLKCGEA